MAKAETKKVGGAKAETAPAGEAPKTEKPKGKPIFDITTAKNAEGVAVPLDENGRLSGVPVNWSPDYAGLKRSQFGSQAVYLEFRAHQLGFSIVRLTDQKADLLQKAEEARKGVDPTTKKLRKLEKLQKMAAELEAQLKADGIEV
jgi:hypothetical protein